MTILGSSSSLQCALLQVRWLECMGDIHLENGIQGLQCRMFGAAVSLSVSSAGPVPLLENKYSQDQKEMQDVLGREAGSGSGLQNSELFSLSYPREVPDTKTSSELCPDSAAFT